MDQVIVFDKSLQQRLNEYLDALSGQETLPVSEIKNVWSFFLELSLDPNGWQALWKIPRLTCEEYKIPFPTVVLVYVENVIFKLLSAVIKILAVQDDVSLPDKHVVPLIQLWPTKEQDKTIFLNIELTANSMDMLRFFYNSLLMPWDYEDEDTSDWLSKHLESRLRLFYDMKNCVIPSSITEHIRALLVEARRLQARKEHIESVLDDDDLDINGGNTEDERLQALMDLHVRIIQIRGEVEILENPVMRNVILKRRDSLPEKERKSPTTWLIFEEGKVDDYVEFLSRVKVFHPNEIVKFASNLKLANSCDTVILSNSRHLLTTIGGLEHGGTLKGIYDKSETVIASMSEDVMLDFSGEVLLQNITINAVFSQCGILVRSGKVTLIDCKLVGDGVSSTHQGIIVLEGSELLLTDCDITAFSTAIVGNSGSKITMQNCKIHDLSFGIKIFDKCSLSVRNSTFYDCHEYGFCVENNDVDKRRIGSFDVLQVVPAITFQDLSGNNNGKGDVVINKKPNIKPVADLFSCPEFDPRPKRESSSEEEMEATNDDELNSTVIENKNCPEEEKTI